MDTKIKLPILVGSALVATSMLHAQEAPSVDIPTTQVPGQVYIVASGDADVQGGAPNQNYGSHTVMHIGNPDKTVFVRFPTDDIPEGATIEKATLRMNVVGSGDEPNEVKLGFVKKTWDESSITFANQPRTNWRKRTKEIEEAGVLEFKATRAVKDWISGARDNNGFAIRSTGPGAIWAFRSREGAPADSRPQLEIHYTTTGAVVEPPRGQSVGSIEKVSE